MDGVEPTKPLAEGAGPEGGKLGKESSVWSVDLEWGARCTGPTSAASDAPCPSWLADPCNCPPTGVEG